MNLITNSMNMSLQTYLTLCKNNSDSLIFHVMLTNCVTLLHVPAVNSCLRVSMRIRSNTFVTRDAGSCGLDAYRTVSLVRCAAVHCTLQYYCMILRYHEYLGTNGRSNSSLSAQYLIRNYDISFHMPELLSLPQFDIATTAR